MLNLYCTDSAYLHLLVRCLQVLPASVAFVLDRSVLLWMVNYMLTLSFSCSAELGLSSSSLEL